MSSLKRVFKTPSIADTVDLGNSIKTHCRNHYILLKGEAPYIGVSFGQAHVYLDEKGLHRVYYKIVSNIKNLHHDDDYLFPIHGLLKNIIHLEPLTILVVAEQENINRLIVQHRNTRIYELGSIVKGFISKKICYMSEIDIGLAGELITGIAKTNGGEVCKDLVITGSKRGEFKYSEEENLVPMNWNGQWYSYIKVGGKTVEHDIILYNGKKLKHVLDKKIYGTSFLVKNTMIYYGYNNNIIVLNNGREMKAIDLDEEKIIWQKLFDRGVSAETHDMFLEDIVYYTSNYVYVLDVVNNNVLFNEKFPSDVSTAYLTQDYLIIGFSDRLYLYERKGREFYRIGKYTVPGSVINTHIYGKNLLVTYMLPSSVLKTMYVNLGDFMNIELSDISMSVNSAVEIPLYKYRANVSLVDESPPNIQIVEYRGRISLVETSGLPGKYNVSMNISIPDHLSVIAEILVDVKGIESIIRKISIPEKPVYSTRGVYIPVTIELESNLDELYIVLSNIDKTVYGSTRLLNNLNSGEVTIPLYVLWAKKGLQDVDLVVIGWSKRNRLYQKYSTSIYFEKDIPLLHHRVFSDTVYIWSPIELGIVDIATTTGEYKLELKQEISRGWNEIEGLRRDFDELVVILPSRVKYVAKRGTSWIEFLK